MIGINDTFKFLTLFDQQPKTPDVYREGTVTSMFGNLMG